MEEQYKKDIRDISLNEAMRIKKKAERDLEEISKTHIEAREKWKMELSEAKARVNKTSVAAEFKKLTARETQRNTSRAIRAAIPKNKGQGIKHVLAPEDWDGDRSILRMHENKEEVEYALIKHINEHFRQVYGTPAVSNKTRDEIGDMATSKQVDQMLEGMYTFEGKLDAHVEKYLKKMKRC